MVIIDTNVIIDHLRLRGNKRSVLEKLAAKHSKESFAISIVTIQELYEGKSTKDPDREKFLLATVHPLKILSYTYEIAQKAGEISRDLEIPIEFPDAAIAATAIINNYQLYTLNKKHFQGIEELALL